MTEVLLAAIAIVLLAAAALLAARSRPPAPPPPFRHLRRCITADAAIVWVPANGGLEERRCSCRVETRRPPGVASGLYVDGGGVTIVDRGHARPRRAASAPTRTSPVQ